MDMLEAMLARVGFSSTDLAVITQPCLVVTGGLSHPRFARLAERWFASCPAPSRQPFLSTAT